MIREELVALGIKVEKLGMLADKFGTAWDNPRSIATAEVFRKWGKRLIDGLDEVIPQLSQPPVCTREWSEDLGVAAERLRRGLPFVMLMAKDSGRKRGVGRDFVRMGQLLQSLGTRIRHIPLRVEYLHSEVDDGGVHNGSASAVRESARRHNEVRATSRAIQREPNAPALLLYRSTRRALLCGQLTTELTDQQMTVLEALIEAQPGGLSLAKLKKMTGGGARNVLERLIEKDKAWSKVIKLPRTAWNGGYRVIAGQLEA